MKTKYYSALLLGLMALYSSSPCAEAQVPVSAAPASPFPVHLVDAQQVPGVVNPTYLTESLWISSHQVINVQNGTANLVVFDAETGQQTPLDLVNTLTKNQEEFYAESAIRTSPDGHWLLWPSGSKAAPTWIAISLDGQERREWPRVTRVGDAEVAWMQDSRHWVELDQIVSEVQTPSGVSHSISFRARVYDTASPQIKKFPLVLDDPTQVSLLPILCTNAQFTFTQDGRAWVSIFWDTAGPSPQFPFEGPRLDAYELIPGQWTWTLHNKSAVSLGARDEVGSSDECVRSPDDNWLIWRNYASDGKGPMRLVLTRTDGSDAQVIQISPEGQNLGHIHWTPDSQHVAFYQNNGMYRITLADLEAKADARQLHSQKQIAGRFKTSGSFPTASSRTLLASRLHRIINMPR